MIIHNKTNLLKLFYKHEHGATAKNIINEIVGHDYFPSKFNNSTNFLELLILNEKELIFKEKIKFVYGNISETIVTIKKIVINRKEKNKKIEILFESNNITEVKKIFNKLKDEFYKNDLNSVKKVNKILIKYRNLEVIK